MQVYRRGMDIGTAKPSMDLQKKLPHHLLDIRNPNEQLTAGDFVRLADKACLEIISRSALPVLFGGTGFYLKNFIFGLPDTPPGDTNLKKALKTELAQIGPETLRVRLAVLDHVSAEKIIDKRVPFFYRNGQSPANSYAISVPSRLHLAYNYPMCAGKGAALHYGKTI